MSNLIWKHRLVLLLCLICLLLFSAGLGVHERFVVHQTGYVNVDPAALYASDGHLFNLAASNDDCRNELASPTLAAFDGNGHTVGELSGNNNLTILSCSTTVGDGTFFAAARYQNGEQTIVAYDGGSHYKWVARIPSQYVYDLKFAHGSIYGLVGDGADATQPAQGEMSNLQLLKLSSARGTIQRQVPASQVCCVRLPQLSVTDFGLAVWWGFQSQYFDFMLDEVGPVHELQQHQSGIVDLQAAIILADGSIAMPLFRQGACGQATLLSHLGAVLFYNRSGDISGQFDFNGECAAFELHASPKGLVVWRQTERVNEVLTLDTNAKPIARLTLTLHGVRQLRVDEWGHILVLSQNGLAAAQFAVGLYNPDGGHVASGLIEGNFAATPSLVFGPDYLYVPLAKGNKPAGVAVVHIPYLGSECGV